LTECGSVVSLNRPGDDGEGDDAGRPLDHVSVRIAEGEIVVGTRAFLGYVGDAAVVPPATPAARREFATGDLGRFDADGHLHLSGRRKNLLITSYGRNIAPEWVESVLLAEPAIAQALVFGDGRPWLSAVLVASPGIDSGALAAAVQRSNHALPDYARIARWHAAAPFYRAERPGDRQWAADPGRYLAVTTPPNWLRSTQKRKQAMSFYEHLTAATAADRAQLFAAPVVADCLQGRVTLASYLAFLGQAYHHVRHTTPLLMTLGGRLPERLSWLRRAVAEYIDEEIGHEEWILNDIAAAGGDADAVRASQPDLAAEVMVAYAYDLLNRGNPAAFFGMVFVLEGTSVALALQAADRIQQALALPNSAFSYLRSHGTLDQQHTRHLADLLERMTPADQADVLRSASVFYQLYADVFRTLPSAEEQPCS
jgi:long-chain acyl-CoA synthetase